MEAHAIRPEDKDWIFMAWHVLLWAVLMSTGTCSGPAPAYADHQGDGHLAAMMYITGVTEAEDLDESTFDELTSYLSTPLAINYASVSRLTGSGLMSGYQIASLVDYRSKAGDVLSVAELAAIACPIRRGTSAVLFHRRFRLLPGVYSTLSAPSACSNMG